MPLVTRPRAKILYSMSLSSTQAFTVADFPVEAKIRLELRGATRSINEQIILNTSFD